MPHRIGASLQDRAVHACPCRWLPAPSSRNALRTSIPEANVISEVTNNDRIPRVIEQRCLFVDLHFIIFAPGDVAQDDREKLLSFHFELRNGSFYRELLAVGAHSADDAEFSHAAMRGLRLPEMLDVSLVRLTKSLRDEAVERFADHSVG